MNNIIDLLFNQFGASESEAIASKVGAEPSQVMNIIKGFIPLVTKGLSQNAQEESGAQSLLSALMGKHDGSILGAFSSALNSDTEQDGGKILNHIFSGQLGGVTQFLSSFANLDQNKVAQIMKYTAPFVMGMLGKKTRENNANTSMLQAMLNQSTQEAQSSDPINMGMIGDLLSGNSSNVQAQIAKTGLNLLKSWMSGRRSA